MVSEIVIRILALLYTVQATGGAIRPVDVARVNTHKMPHSIAWFYVMYHIRSCNLINPVYRDQVFLTKVIKNNFSSLICTYVEEVESITGHFKVASCLREKKNWC